MTIANYQATGTASSTSGGTGNTTPAWPTITAGDLGLVAAENDAVAPSMPYTAHPASPTNTAFATVLALSYKRTAGSETTPTIADPGNHCHAVINTIRNAHQVYPFHRHFSGGNASSTTMRWPSFDTLVDDCLIALFGTWNIDVVGGTAQLSSPTNASLSSLTERYDGGTDDANGGGIFLLTGEKSSAGKVDETTATLAGSAGSVFIGMAIAPIADIPIIVQILVDEVEVAPGVGEVRLYDKTQREATYLVVNASQADAPGVPVDALAYGDGLFADGAVKMFVPYIDHEYIAVYSDASGEIYGSSETITYVGSPTFAFPFTTIGINTSSGDGSGGGYSRGRLVNA